MNYFWKAITLGLLTSLLGIAVSFTHYGLDLEENFGLASLFKLRGERQAPPAVVVISLDKESADRLNLPQDVRRWPRSHHAHLIQKLIDESASVIVFDLNFKY
jgi:adenylate cyclase